MEAINNISEYIKAIQKINSTENEKKFLFYRGVNNTDYCLTPKIFRKREPQYNEREILLDYKQYLPQLSPNYSFPKDVLKILADMQHQGIPTRLLDWTTSPLIALFFACEKNNSEVDSKIFVLNPWKLWKTIVLDGNKNINSDIHQIHIYTRALLSLYQVKSDYQIDEIINILKKEYSFEISPELFKEKFKMAFPFVSSFSNDRIVAQKGCFTIHGLNESSIECQEQGVLHKFFIDKSAKKKIIEELNLLGIDDYSVFPDYEGMRKSFERKGSLFNNKI